MINNKLIQKIGFIFMSMILGCSFTESSINKRFENINITDGVNDSEARAIGVKKASEDGFNVQSLRYVFVQQSKKYPNVWIVQFIPYYSSWEYNVVINKLDGNVVYHQSTPKPMFNNWDEFLEKNIFTLEKL